MEIRFDVKNVYVEEKQGISKAGKPYHMFNQTVWAYTYDRSGVVNPFPEKVVVSLDEGQSPYPIGSYYPAPESFEVGDFNSYRVGRLKLVPIPAAPAQRPVTNPAAQ